MQFYYFTRTGRSRTIATTMANEQNTKAFEIIDNENWNGVRGFLKGGKKSKLKEEVTAHFTAPNENETVVLVFPLWAGSFPPTVREFLKCVDKNRIIAVPSSLGSRLKKEDRAGFIHVFDLVGKEITAPSSQELLEVNTDEKAPSL